MRRNEGISEHNFLTNKTIIRAAETSCLFALLALVSVFSSSAQTVLTNGAETAGTLLANSTNTYTFDATNADAILLRVGAPAINPRIVLYVQAAGLSPLRAAESPGRMMRLWPRRPPTPAFSPSK